MDEHKNLIKNLSQRLKRPLFVLCLVSFDFWLVYFLHIVYNMNTFVHTYSYMWFYFKLGTDAVLKGFFFFRKNKTILDCRCTFEPLQVYICAQNQPILVDSVQMMRFKRTLEIKNRLISFYWFIFPDETIV